MAIITENFLPKVDGVTRTLARLLDHLNAEGHDAIVLGPETGVVRRPLIEPLATSGLLCSPSFFSLPSLARVCYASRCGDFRPTAHRISRSQTQLLSPALHQTTAAIQARCKCAQRHHFREYTLTFPTLIRYVTSSTPSGLVLRCSSSFRDGCPRYPASPRTTQTSQPTPPFSVCRGSSQRCGP